MPRDSKSAYVIVLCCVAAIGGFLFGFDSGVINGTVDALAKAFGTDAAGTGFAVASVLLGCAVGAFGAGRLADSLGRRPTMLLNAILFLVTAVATGAANSAAFFIAARITAGVAIGGASVLAPMYIAEVAPAHMRGRLASLQQMAIVVGLFSAFLSNAILARVAGGASEIFWFGAPTWRWMFWMEAVPAATARLIAQQKSKKPMETKPTDQPTQNPEPKNSTKTATRPPLPPFTRETAIQKVRLAENGWNSRDPGKVALAYTIDSQWRNRAEFPNGRQEIIEFLTRKWARELEYRLIKELWTYEGNRIAVRFAYEWHDDSGHRFRSYGNENWEFDEHGLMRRRHASINDFRSRNRSENIIGRSAGVRMSIRD